MLPLHSLCAATLVTQCYIHLVNRVIERQQNNVPLSGFSKVEMRSDSFVNEQVFIFMEALECSLEGLQGLRGMYLKL